MNTTEHFLFRKVILKAVSIQYKRKKCINMKILFPSLICMHIYIFKCLENNLNYNFLQYNTTSDNRSILCKICNVPYNIIFRNVRFEIITTQKLDLNLFFKIIYSIYNVQYAE